MPRPGRYWPDTRNNSSPPPAHWDRHAACRRENPAVFFPEGSESDVLAMTATAKSICRRCPVSGRCQVESLERAEPFGVWGGLDEYERHVILRVAAERAAERADSAPEEAVDAFTPAATAA